MGKVGVIATVGADPGLTREERIQRSLESRWTRELGILIAKRERLSQRLRAAHSEGNLPMVASLDQKLADVTQRIVKAKMMLKRMVN